MRGRGVGSKMAPCSCLFQWRYHPKHIIFFHGLKSGTFTIWIKRWTCSPSSMKKRCSPTWEILFIAATKVGILHTWNLNQQNSEPSKMRIFPQQNRERCPNQKWCMMNDVCRNNTRILILWAIDSLLTVADRALKFSGDCEWLTPWNANVFFIFTR